MKIKSQIKQETNIKMSNVQTCNMTPDNRGGGVKVHNLTIMNNIY